MKGIIVHYRALTCVGLNVRVENRGIKYDTTQHDTA